MNSRLAEPGRRRRKVDLTILTILGLKTGGITFVGLIGDDCENIDIFIEDALTGLVDREAHATTDLLAFLHLGSGLIEGTDLEDIGVIPAFLECRVGKDETCFSPKERSFSLSFMMSS